MLQTRSSRWVAGTLALCLGLLALSYVALIGPRRDEAVLLEEQNLSAQSQNDGLRIKIAQLRAQFVKLPQSQAELAEILRQVPPTADTPKLLRDLDAMAAAAGVTLKSVTPGVAQYLAPAGQAGSGQAAMGQVSAQVAAGQAATGQAAQVVAVPQTLLVEGDYFQTVVFLRKLQGEMKRAFLVTGLEITAAAAEKASATQGRVNLTITGQTFALPSAAPATPAPAPATPGPAASTPATPSPAASGPATPTTSATPATAAPATPGDGTPTTPAGDR